MPNLFERKLCQPGVVQHLLAVCVRRVPDLHVQLVGVQSAVLTHTLLRLQHAGAHVPLIGAQLEVLHTRRAAEASCPARVLPAGLLAGQTQGGPCRVHGLQVTGRSVCLYTNGALGFAADTKTQYKADFYSF